MIYPDTTAIWEKELEEVATGKASYEKFYESQLNGLSLLLDKARKTKIMASSSSVLCPNCEKVMVRRKGKNGFFWGCSNYPECKTTVQDNNGKPNFTASIRKKVKSSIVKL